MTDLWTGDFGNNYTRRNGGSTFEARRQLWRILLPRHCESILEVGANIGLNLEAIGTFSQAELYACEPNEMAREALHDSNVGVSATHITADFAHKISFPDGIADLAFTMGVLIHIPTDKLIQSMREIHRCAKRWIVCGEYFAPQEEMIPYRGHDNALWRRDYGSLYLDNFPDLQCISTMFAWRRMTGLDNLTFWVFEKNNLAN